MRLGLYAAIVRLKTEHDDFEGGVYVCTALCMCGLLLRLFLAIGPGVA